MYAIRNSSLKNIPHMTHIYCNSINNQVTKRHKSEKIYQNLKVNKNSKCKNVITKLEESKNK